MTSLLLALAWLVFAPAPSFAEEEPAQLRECVVLLHGLWRSGLSMKALEWRLEDEGYAVANVSYPSLFYSIEELAQLALEDGLGRCADQQASPVNIVTHSLGGILVRRYLRDNTLSNLGRVVMLGPPNQGSQMADYYAAIDMLDFLTPQAVDELTTGEFSVPRSLGPVTFELGVIAGNSSRRPPLPGVPAQASDGTVTVDETRVEGMSDFIELPAGHTFMMWTSEVLDQVVYFLLRGSFDHAASAKEQP